MNKLSQQLRDACVGHPHAEIPWPHRLLHEAANHIDDLEAELATIRNRAGEATEYVLAQINAELRVKLAELQSQNQILEGYKEWADTELAKQRGYRKCDGNHGGPSCGDPECWQL